MATRSHERTSVGQNGSVAVLVGLSLVILAGMSALAVDYGYLEYKRSQLQNAADAAALAGANVLLQYGTKLSQVTDTSVTYGQANLSESDAKNLAIRDSDVTFPNTATVQAVVGRTTARGNPVEMFLGRVLGWNTQDITAHSKAALFCSGGSNCLKPWSPPAKFTWNDTCDTNKKYYNNGQLDAESTCEMNSVEVQGYTNDDVGTQILLKFGDATSVVTPGHYQPVDYPAVNRGTPQTGADMYRTNIAGCSGSNNTRVSINDQLEIEPGNMVGPTQQGLTDLIAQDPGATWNDSTKSIENSAFSNPMQSPRVALIPFYDPRFPQVSGRNMITVYQLGAVFIEAANGSGDVTGRFIKAMAINPVRQANCDPAADYALFGAGFVQ